MRIRSVATCLTLAVAAACASAAGASADTINFDMPIGPAAVMNDCTGEAVVIEGTAHFKVTDNSSLDAIKSQIEMNLTGVKGTTATGVQYVMNVQNSDIIHADFDSSGDAQQTLEATTILNRQRETAGLVTGDDLRVRVFAHLTVTNGRITAARSPDVTLECR